mmetsp:Transcript_13226/g.28709  ORF Transcript_13226/g.28709 Transcript_13226/m.28709 type:complete len:200 (-) Transcript_13226:245-844(-)
MGRKESWSISKIIFLPSALLRTILVPPIASAVSFHFFWRARVPALGLVESPPFFLEPLVFLPPSAECLSDDDDDEEEEEVVSAFFLFFDDLDLDETSPLPLLDFFLDDDFGGLAMPPSLVLVVDFFLTDDSPLSLGGFCAFPSLGFIVVSVLLSPFPLPPPLVATLLSFPLPPPPLPFLLFLVFSLDLAIFSVRITGCY